MTRPDPDALLAQLKREEAKSTRGKLKIFFGMSPGVGKTYAMLLAAREKQAEGCEVVVGIVETHGRKETEALLEGMPIMPRLCAAIESRTRPATLMKAARTYVFVFVPILLERVANMRGATGFGAGSNGSSPSDEEAP
jgi:hypothetical protein